MPQKILLLCFQFLPLLLLAQGNHDTPLLPQITMNVPYPEPRRMNYICTKVHGYNPYELIQCNDVIMPHNYFADSTITITQEKIPNGIDPEFCKVLLNHFSANLTYPKMVLERGIFGCVYVYFIVEENGTVSNASILRKIEMNLDNEVLRVVSTIPAFQIKNTKPTRLEYILPVEFEFRLPRKKIEPMEAAKELPYGSWVCVKREGDIAKQAAGSDLPMNNLRISEDSVWFFEYPCMYYGATRLCDSLLEQSCIDLVNMKLNKDTLVIVPSDDMQCTRYYVREHFEPYILDELMKDSMYLPAFYGTWYLEVQRPENIKNGLPIDIKYPVHLDKTYLFNETNVINKKNIMIRVNGKLENFEVVKFSFEEAFIELKSGSWAEEPFTITYFAWERKYDKKGQRIIK